MAIANPRRARRALLAAALAAAVLPAAADASTVRVGGIGPTQEPQVQYTAAPGESNDLRVSFTGTHIHIRDSVPITVGNGCVIDATGAALCVPGNFQDQYSLGDGRDTMRYLAPHAARVDMGAGDDTYFGALRQDSIGQNGKVVRPADVVSGTGNDLVTYRSSQRGVRVTLDGLLNDGDRGEENIRPDVEHVEGSNGIDTLIGSDDAEKVEQFSGLGGNDTLEGLGGTDIFNEGSRSQRRGHLPRPVGHRPRQLQPADDSRHGRHGQPPAHAAARPVRATSSTRTPTTPSAARPATTCSAARARTCSRAAAASTSCAATAAPTA